ncbi:MAG: histidinol-phosphate transaminase [Lachnospiraceae bacterium]|nr:histidinol-phosphate transaminase [Lachnospiraceae bacterium]
MKAWEKNIRKVVPYVPGEQPKVDDIVKLNTNENPYPPAKGVSRALLEFDSNELKLYPDPTIEELKSTLAEYYGVNVNEVFVGVGSDDVLAMAFLTFFNSDKPILFPDITYSFYPVWADLYKIPYECPKLDENFMMVKEDYYKENGGIIFPNPNAPTAICNDLGFIEDIVKNNQESVVIVDEAYVDFGGESAIELTKKYENLLVVQTFSKSRSMAGMRIGYAIGSKELIKAMEDVKYSFNSYTMNMTAIKSGVEAVKDDEYFKETKKKIVTTRENTAKSLKALGFDMTDSKANFLFVTHKKYAARDIYEYLRTKHIFVRYFNLPRIDNYLRITIGTDEQMEKLIKALEEYCEKAVSTS